MFKNTLAIYALALVVVLSSVTISFAEENAKQTSLSIAVVDVQQLMNNSKAAKSIQKQGKKLKDKYQKRIEKLEKDLKSAEKEVVEAGKAKDKEKFIEGRKEFQKELVKSQKEFQKMNKNLDSAIAKALNVLRDEIIEIVDDMTSDKGYDLVLTRADIVTVSKDIDITDKVMKTLNKSLPSVDVKE